MEREEFVYSVKIGQHSQKMHKLELNILEFSEVRRSNKYDVCQNNNTTLYFSSNDRRDHYNGIAILLDTNTNSLVISFILYSGRTMLNKLKAQPTNIDTIQCYSSITEKPDREIKTFYKN